MWPTCCGVTHCLISGIQWPRELAFQISNGRECECLRASVLLSETHWLLCLHRGRASWGLLPDSNRAPRDIEAAPCLGDVRFHWRLTWACRVFESLTQLSLTWTAACPAPTQPSFPSPLPASLKVRLGSQPDSSPNLSQPPPSSPTGIFPNTLLACLITSEHLLIKGPKLTPGWNIRKWWGYPYFSDVRRLWYCGGWNTMPFISVFLLSTVCVRIYTFHPRYLVKLFSF